mgnify:CR=1 FL=1
MEILYCETYGTLHPGAGVRAELRRTHAWQSAAHEGRRRRGHPGSRFHCGRMMCKSQPHADPLRALRSAGLMEDAGRSLSTPDGVACAQHKQLVCALPSVGILEIAGGPRDLGDPRVSQVHPFSIAIAEQQQRPAKLEHRSATHEHRPAVLEQRPAVLEQRPALQ